MSDLPTLNKNIKHIIYHKADGNTSKFAEMIGVSQQKLNRIFRIDARTSKYPDPNKTDILERILNTFNDIDEVWLRTGSGEMISMEGKPLNANYAKNKDGVMMGESEIYYNLKDTVTQVDSDNYMEVEYRDLSVAAGPLNRTDEKAPRKTMLVPREFDRGEYLVVRVDGPSMDDGSIYAIPEGAKILIKRYYLHNGDKLPIRGNLFVIDAKEGQALKQIVEHNTELGYVRCHSYNPEFRDYNIPLEEVYGFYIFRKIVAFRPPVRDIEN